MTRIYNFLSSTVTLITRQTSILFGQRTIIMKAINHDIINKHRFSAKFASNGQARVSQLTICKLSPL